MDNKPDFCLKNIKTFRAMEGEGYNATLYVNGVKTAFVDDAGCGGELDITVLNNITYLLAKKWAEAQPDYVFTGSGVEVTKDTPEEDIYRIPYQISILVEDLMNKHFEKKYKEKLDKKFMRDCLTKTLFTLKDSKSGTHWVINNKFSPQVKAYLENKYGDKLSEIINERYL